MVIEAQIGFVFSNTLSLILMQYAERRTPNDKIDFVWLCFFVPRRVKYCHKILSNNSLRYFATPANWVCFFKFVFQPPENLGAK